jgi:hypothetical protein
MTETSTVVDLTGNDAMPVNKKIRLSEKDEDTLSTLSTPVVTITPRMKYKDGEMKTNSTQQLIAFWVHTIDTYAGITDNGSDFVPTMGITEDEVPDSVYESTGTNSDVSFMGAVRMGYRLAIDNLPDEVRIPVKNFIKSRLGGCVLYGNTDIKLDFIFGEHTPVNEEDDTSSDEE